MQAGTKAKIRDTFRIMLEIRETLYYVIPQTVTPEDGPRVRVLLLKKRDGTRYRLTRFRSGPLTCTCPDFVHRGEVTCKHIRACVKSGLL